MLLLPVNAFPKFFACFPFFLRSAKNTKDVGPKPASPMQPGHPSHTRRPPHVLRRSAPIVFYTGPGPRTSQLQAIRTASAVVRREATVHKPFYDLGVNIPFFPFSRCVFEPRENPCKNLMATQRKMRLLFCVWVLCPFQPNSRIFSRFCFRYGLRRRVVLYRDGDPPPFSVME